MEAKDRILSFLNHAGTATEGEIIYATADKEETIGDFVKCIDELVKSKAIIEYYCNEPNTRIFADPSYFHQMASEVECEADF